MFMVPFFWKLPIHGGVAVICGEGHCDKLSPMDYPLVRRNETKTGAENNSILCYIEMNSDNNLMLDAGNLF